MGIIETGVFLILGLVAMYIGATLILTGQAIGILIGLPTGIVGFLVAALPHIDK